MTPKEKAEELVIKMYQPLPASKEAEKGKERLYYNQYNAAKQCALISVDEILKEQSKSSEYKNPKYQDGRINYWMDVKQEIETL